jgi:hypothetical protein
MRRLLSAIRVPARIFRTDVLGGLIHEYEAVAAMDLTLRGPCA